MFYSQLDSLCAEHGITVTELMKELGLNPSSASRWKNKGYLPSRSAAKKMADYFGLTVAELMEDKTEKAPAQKNEDSEVAQLLTEIRDRPELRTMFIPMGYLMSIIIFALYPHS